MRWRVAVCGAGFLILAALFATGGRAASGVAVILLCALAAVVARTLGLGRAAWAGALLVIAAAILVGGTSALQRQIENTEDHNILSQRDLIWNRGLVAWRATPWFGVGPDNYSQITVTDLRTELAAEGKPYVATEYAGAPHAHNLYINVLVERGIVGLAALLAVLLTWGALLLRRWPQPGMQSAPLVIWGASFSAWLVTVVIGFANTTLHHEHAMLALMALGLWLGDLRQYGRPVLAVTVVPAAGAIPDPAGTVLPRA
jgi:O-antigen ligase